MSCFPTTTARRFAVGLLVALLAISASSRAELFDRIDVKDRDSEAEVRIGFTVPMRYVQHHPRSSGQIIEVFFDVVSLNEKEPAPPSELIDRETKKSPPSDLVPSFTLTWDPKQMELWDSSNPDSKQNPKDAKQRRTRVRITIQFERPVLFRVEEGKDGRSFLLFINRASVNGTTT